MHIAHVVVSQIENRGSYVHASKQEMRKEQCFSSLNLCVCFVCFALLLKKLDQGKKNPLDLWLLGDLKGVNLEKSKLILLKRQISIIPNCS